MNVEPDNRYTKAIKGLLFDIGFSADRVSAVNITDGRIEVQLCDLPHANPALQTSSTISIDYTKEGL